MLRFRLLLLACCVVVAVSGSRAQPQNLFTFHSNPWLNLHHYLRAGVRGMSAPAGLSVEEQQQWAAAVQFYKPYAQRDLFSDELHAITEALRTAENKTALDGVAIDAGLKTTLERIMPIYRKSAWPEQDRVNRAWIAAVQPLLDRHGPALSRAIARAYESTWPSDPIAVDLTVVAGPDGAFTTGPPIHITIASPDRSYSGLHALEMLFHESSHSEISNIFSRVMKAADEQKVTVPRQLWHGVLFYTAGELTTRELSAHGIAYAPYADDGLYKNLCGEGCRAKIVEHWTPRLDGTRSMSESLAALVAAFR
jgi:hypothetical protein